MKRTLIALAVLALSLSYFAGRAAATTIACYTALGYTITCQPKLAVHNDFATGAFIYQFKMGSTATNATSGSFTWNEITVTDGYEVSPYGDLGDSYVYQSNPTSLLSYSTHWFCYPVNQITVSAIGFSLYNASTVGYWDLYSTSGTDCYMPTPYQDYLTWQAY